MSKLLVTAALLFSVGPAPALAEDRAWRIGKSQYHLYFRDLDLDSRTDRAVMLARVEKAAGKLCADFRIERDREECVKETVLSATRSKDGAPLRRALRERHGAYSGR